MAISILTKDAAFKHRADLIALLQNAVDAGASIGFLPPLDETEAAEYWDHIIAELDSSRRLLIAAVEDGRVVGCVQLNPESRKNGDHRAEVQKLMVHTGFRRRGIADALMAALIEHAQTLGLRLLVLDVREGDTAEHVYRKHGFIVSGTIPAYARSADGSFDGSTFYYRLLEG